VGFSTKQLLVIAGIVLAALYASKKGILGSTFA
jgi:hypothetical protein